jgi:hypothetical protein
MSNTLTDLFGDFYQSMDVVSRELTGLIPAVALNASAERVALGQKIRTFVTPKSSSTNITPAVIPPDTGDQTIGNRYLTISKSKMIAIRATGEEEKELNTSYGYATVQGKQVEQAMRALVNEVESDLASFYYKFSRAATTGGTTIFDSTAKLGDIAKVRQILVDNGASQSDLHLVIGTTEGTALRSLTQLTNQNEAGSQTILRQGVLIEPILGLAVRESAAIADHTKGTASSATTNTAGYAIGSTTITLASAGTGTLVAGDIITFTGDANQYVVVSGDADVSNGGTFTIAEPGLRKALAASAISITVVDKGRRNMAFARDAIQLALRAPAVPSRGDLATDRTLITDPRTGLTFDISYYPQYYQGQIQVGLAWGWEVIKPEHTALLVG